MEPISYVGTRWFKCDFHLHTPASKCFEQENVTAEEWVNAAVDKDLDCVAVTDHNSGDWIDKIKEASEGKPLTIFPGVELTCSDAKVHLLILFDTDKTKQDVEDFLISLGLNRSVFGTDDAHSNLNIEAIADKVKEKNALIIASHIDDYSSLSNVAHKTRSDFLNKESVAGVQIVHPEFLKSESDYKASEVKSILDKRYGQSIDAGMIKNWRTTVQLVVNNNIPLLTFSDNPINEGNAKHGLWGIGERYTWIKMDEKPSLESLRQALLLHNFRICNDIIIKKNQKPFKVPELWIKSLEVSNSSITDNSNPLLIKFSPQMTSIIGGRGSGKSSILRFIRGLFENKVAELNDLEDIHKDFTKFFQVQDRKGTGVLLPATKIDIEFIRKGTLHRIEFLQENKLTSKLIIKRYNADTKAFDVIDNNSYLDFFEFDIFSQKQIYDISTKTNSLRNRIDDIVDEISTIKTDLQKIEKSYFTKSTQIREIEVQISGKGKLQTEIDDINNRIKTFNESGINDIINSRQKFEKDNTVLKSYKDSIIEFRDSLKEALDEIDLPEIDLSEIQDEFREVIEPLINQSNKDLNSIYQSINNYLDKIDGIHNSFDDNLKKSKWFESDNKSKTELEEKKTELAKLGISDLEIIEGEIKDVEQKKGELKRIEITEGNLKKEIAEKEKIKTQYITKRKELSDARQKFLSEILKDRNVKAEVRKFRDFKNYEEQLRSIIGSDDGFEMPIKDLITTIEKGESINNNQKIFDEIIKLIETGSSGIITDGHFQRKLKSLSGEQYDKIDLLFPEDEITVKYKVKGSDSYKSISNASAGQKTAAILTLLLSHGEIPLILDQPEDDLDNHLIYELVVDQLRHSKEYRQIIVVTHNANIPVNGDSEYIIGMNSESPHIEILIEGTIEDNHIKDEICDVMEGGTEAFEMRSKRYNL
ncbi:MAG: PHP domain-containing protein [Bacteroidales bacterium]|nr:PHP domain-containing protein [Bacteroidales bacterium]